MDGKNLKQGDLFQSRYEVISLIARGGMGTTYLSLDKTNGKKVVLKVLAFSEVGDWKVLELFEREIEILQSLQHSNIPQYVDHFRYENGSELLFVLVQKFVSGKNLEEAVKSGRRFSENDVKRMIKDLAQSLEYIHNIQPSIIHRDVNPRNIIIGDDGKTYLVDFNASGRVAKSTRAAGGTYVGTFGYMAQEQLYGKAYPATDIYGLGMTMIFLLSRMHPDQFPLKKMKIDYHAYVNIQPMLKDLLDKMIEPDVNQRIQSCSEILDILSGKSQKQRIGGKGTTLKELKDAGLIKIPDEQKKKEIAKTGKILLIAIFIMAAIIIYVGTSKKKTAPPVRRYYQTQTESRTLRITGPENIDFDRIVDFKDTSIRNLVISPDGKYIAGAGNADVILVWEVETGRQLKRLVGHRREIISIRFIPNTGNLISLSDDKKAIIWEWASGKILRMIHLDKFIFARAEISHNGDKIYITDYSKRLSVINTLTGMISEIIDVGINYTRIMKISSNGRFAALHNSKTVFLIDLQTKANWSVETADFLYDIIFSPDNNYLYIENAARNLSSYSLYSRQFVSSGTPVQYSIYAMAISPDNRLLAFSQFSDLYLYDNAEKKMIAILKNVCGSYYSFKKMELSADKNFVFIEYKNHSVLRLNIEKKKIDKVYIPQRNPGRAGIDR